MIDRLNISTPQVFTKPTIATNPATVSESQNKFANYLKDALNKVNEAQNTSDQFTKKLAMGENVDLHQVMIAAEKASVSLTATLEIRNKVIEAYQEVMRMPL